MNTVVFWIISIITIALSEICHPPIEWWVPVSAVAWALILISLAVAFFVRKKSEAALNAGLVALFIFWEYAIISVFSFTQVSYQYTGIIVGSFWYAFSYLGYNSEYFFSVIMMERKSDVCNGIIFIPKT